jgi:hypothetical protein
MGKGDWCTDIDGMESLLCNDRTQSRDGFLWKQEQFGKLAADIAHAAAFLTEPIDAEIAGILPIVHCTFA